MIQDRDLLIAIFDAIGALSERLTGDRLVIDIPDARGNIVSFYGGSRRTHWESPKTQHPLSRAHEPSFDLARQESAASKNCDIRDPANAKSQALDLAAGPMAIP
jgi:hypothetical protein